MLLPRDETTDPKEKQVLGLEKGTVYLQRPFPVTGSPSGPPAHAA